MICKKMNYIKNLFTLSLGILASYSALAGNNYHQIISAGDDHSCAIMKDSTVNCWGSNGNGQLGNGTYISSSFPVPVFGIKNAITITSGYSHTCALLDDGTVQCWGYHGAGNRFENKADTDNLFPTPIFGLKNVLSISAGAIHTCALTADSTVYCWGNNKWGQLGNGTNNDSLVTPIQVPGLKNTLAISSGFSHTCALTDDGTVQCWGNNFSGELGNEKSRAEDGYHRSIPIPVLGLKDVLSISAGDHHTCALISDGTVQCWGDNTWGELGNGTTGMHPSYPVPVLGLKDVLSISSGGLHTCARISDGSAQCWGVNNYGQLGSETNNELQTTPIQVFGLKNVLTISSGSFHTCALTAADGILCWGNNQNGELGNGTTFRESHIPVEVQFPR